MGNKIVDRHQPSLGAGLEALSSKSRVMGIDALRGARKVRQPVQSSSQALEAFDGITYVKGMSILGMTEGWVGEERFRTGIRRYIAAHRHRTATARDLFEALGSATGERVTEVMDSFLDQTGVPLVDTKVDCGKKQIRLAQSEYRLLGVEGPNSKRWSFPVCMRYLADKPRSACTLLAAEGGEIALEGGVCPKLVYPNLADRGYYHYALAEPELTRLARSASFLDESERIGLIGNAWALVKSGALGADAYLRLLGLFATGKSRVTWERIVGSLEELERIVGEADRARFARFVSGLLGPTARRLGFVPRPGESDDQRLFRKTLLSALGRLGDDAWVRTEAARVARAWRDDPKSVDADVAAVAVTIDAEHGDEQLFSALSARLVRVQPPEQRLIAIGGLAGLSDPKLVERALALVLDASTFKAQDVRYLLPPLFARRETREVAWAWTRANYPALEKRLPPFVFGRMAWVIANFCDDGQVETAAKFFAPRLDKIEGADKPMRQAVEAGKLCAALARGQREALARGLGAQP
jgi:alanyl aminopeptidase